jgi:hypothetical protein
VPPEANAGWRARHGGFDDEAASFVVPFHFGDGRQRAVRPGQDPVRTIQTGIGTGEVQKPKAGSRSCLAGGWRAHSLRVSGFTKMGVVNEEPRRAPAGSLSARNDDERCPEGGLRTPARLRLLSVLARSTQMGQIHPPTPVSARPD